MNQFHPAAQMYMGESKCREHVFVAQELQGGYWGHTITLRRGCKGEEELATVRVLATIGHGQDTRATVLELQRRLLIVERCPMYAVPP